MQDLIPVNILIGDRNYRIKVSPGDEEHVRKTIKLINEKIIEFKTSFAGKDMQDYVAMVLLWYATQPNTLATNEVPGNNDDNISASLNKLEQQIDQLLIAEKE
jgi:cell division protein ZapA (FtsZ GTPase activity inhibitor)